MVGPISGGEREAPKEVLESFYQAIRKNDIQRVTGLLQEYNIPADHRYNQGDTALHLAVRHGNVDMVRLIVERMGNIDFTAQNRRANTALCLAVQLAKPNTQLYNEQQRAVLRERYEKICLVLIAKDPDITKTANLKNVMRKSAIDYLSKSVRNPVIRQALERRLLETVARESNVSQSVKDSVKVAERATPSTHAARERERRRVAERAGVSR